MQDFDFMKKLQNRRNVTTDRARNIKLVSKSVIMLMLLIWSVTSQAGIDDLVKDVFPAGTMVNSTNTAIVQEQAAGHLIGGSLVVKSPANPKLQLLRAQAPSCKLGGLPCGAQIELLGGSLSLISGEELMQYLKSIPANAASYGAMMAIKTLCSQCHQVLEYLDGKADFLNQFNLDSCSMMQNLMDPIFAKMQAKMQGTRQADMLLSGECTDMAQCQRASKRDNGNAGYKSKELESQLGDNYNLVWKALSEKRTKSGISHELKELLMSISGTVIGTKSIGGKLSVQHVKSLVNRDLIKQFIGNDAKDSNLIKLYHCDEPSQCLKPKVKEVRARPQMFLFQRIKRVLESITQKILENKGILSLDEEAIVALSSEQLILKIEMDLATYSNRLNVISNQYEYIESLAYDVVTNYLQSLLTEVQQAVGELSHAQLGDADKFRAFEQETREIMRLLSQARQEARGRYDLIIKTKERRKRQLDYFQREFESFVGGQN